MVAATSAFAQWLQDAAVPAHSLTAEQQALLQAAFQFRQQQGTDYYSTRLLSHFLLHCGSGLKVAHIARLLSIHPTTASRQHGLSSKQAVQQAHHRLDGRPFGKLLPRFAGPIAEYLLHNPQASRYDLLDFISATFAIRVSRVALYHFLKKYGLEHLPGPTHATVAPSASRVTGPSDPPVPSSCPATPLPGVPPAPPPGPGAEPARPLATPPAPPFSADVPSLLAPFCC